MNPVMSLAIGDMDTSDRLGRVPRGLRPAFWLEVTESKSSVAKRRGFLKRTRWETKARVSLPESGMVFRLLACLREFEVQIGSGST